jgi:hypothetical protein
LCTETSWTSETGGVLKSKKLDLLDQKAVPPAGPEDPSNHVREVSHKNRSISDISILDLSSRLHFLVDNYGDLVKRIDSFQKVTMIQPVLNELWMMTHFSC